MVGSTLQQAGGTSQRNSASHLEERRIICNMRFHDQILSEEDFEQLPPTLQRKVSTFSPPRVGLRTIHPPSSLPRSYLPKTVYNSADRVDQVLLATRTRQFVRLWMVKCRWAMATSAMAFQSLGVCRQIQQRREQRRLASSPAAPTFPLGLQEHGVYTHHSIGQSQSEPVPCCCGAYSLIFPTSNISKIASMQLTSLSAFPA